MNDAKDAVRYRYWRDHYMADFVLTISKDRVATFNFSSVEANVQILENQSAQIDAAIDRALLAELDNQTKGV